jgi:hypothetical protein
VGPGLPGLPSRGRRDRPGRIICWRALKTT